MTPILSVPPWLSSNTWTSPRLPCTECGMAVSISADSLKLIESDPGEYKPYCIKCAAAHWPDMLIAGTEGVWYWTEEYHGVKIGQIRAGPITITQWLRGARRANIL